MVQVKRNSTEFKDVKNILEEYAANPARRKLIRIYALKPSEELSDKVLINDLKKDAAVLYDMHYNTILDYFADRSEKLYREDKTALYFFKSSPGSTWMKVPFELTGKLKKRVFPLSIVK